MVFLQYVGHIFLGEDKNNKKNYIIGRLVNLIRLLGLIIVLIGPAIILQQFTRAESIAPIGAVWFADHTTVNRISTDSNAITQIIPVADSNIFSNISFVRRPVWVL